MVKSTRSRNYDRMKRDPLVTTLSYLLIRIVPCRVQQPSVECRAETLSLVPKLSFQIIFTRWVVMFGTGLASILPYYYGGTTTLSHEPASPAMEDGTLWLFCSCEIQNKDLACFNRTFYPYSGRCTRSSTSAQGLM